MIIIGEKINGSIPVVAKAIAERDAEFIKETKVEPIVEEPKEASPGTIKFL